MKIDFHVHITPPEIINNWEKYAEKEPYFSLLSNSPQNKFSCAEDVIAALDESNFERAVVFGFAFKDQGLCGFVNDYVIEKARRFPDKLTGFISVSPGAKNMRNEIERCYTAGLRGIGELFPEEQGFNIDNEKETRALTGVCVDLGIPLILHVNEPVGHDYAGKNNIPLKKIERFVSNSKNLNVILAHFGGGLLFYETMKEIKEKLLNVYYDTAAAPFLYDSRIYKVVKALGITEKILFGSDFPLLHQSRYTDAIENSGLSGEEKQLVFGANAWRLLNRDNRGGENDKVRSNS
jgi:predicted TIM-barrel fold metal-dependent hydrolase